MLITTTPNIEGKQIAEYLGIVSSCAMAAFPGNDKMIKRGWDGTMKTVTDDIESQATELGADAIVGVKVDVVRSGMTDNMYITGTAVKLD